MRCFTLFLVFLLLKNTSGIVEFFTPDELRYTFGVTKHSEIPDYEEVHPKVVYGDDGSLNRLKVKLSGRHFDLNLSPSTRSLISPQYTVVHRNHNGSSQLTVGEEPQNCHYISIGNETHAAVSNCDGNIKGTIIDSTGIHVIHPFPDRHAHRAKRGVDNENGVHVIYKRDTVGIQDDFCGIDNTITEQSLMEDDAAIFEDVFVTGQKLTQQSDLVVELAVFVDETLWRHFNSKHGGQASRKLQDYTLTLLNNIQIMYYQPTATPPLTFRVIRYEVLQSQPSSIAGYQHQQGNAQQYLDKFCRYQRNLGVRDWDHAIMLTGYDIHRGQGSKSISGIARLDGMCDPWNTCTLAEGLDFTSAFIGTHELGHSVGMRHDEPYCPSKHIMSSSLGPGKVTWSSCSLRDYHQFVQKLDARGKNCMRVSNMPVRLTIPTGSKPGQLYDANLQCELMHGPGYKQVTPRQDTYDGICYMMWCGQSSFGRIITSHPALEGTFCGPSKWCKLGRCVPWSGSRAPAHDAHPGPSAVTTTQTPTTRYTPRRINGGWSGWSSANCHQCSCSGLEGSLGVTISRRTCSSPYPQNGGAECSGSTLRALVCNRQCPHRTTSVDSYISGKCSEHKRLKNDHDLTGKGSQLTRYPQRACKVFCDVANRYGSQRNYRFFGDNLPDGTSCGSNRYCLDGECLPLSCNSGAVIGRDLACPRTKCPLTTVSVRGRWGVWSLWTSCTVTCGGGYRKRSRVCNIYGQCDGSTDETENCASMPCPRARTHAGSSWTSWTEWNQCSVSCGKGSKARYRKCVSPYRTLAFDCPGEKHKDDGVRRTIHKDKNIEVRLCDAGACSGVGLWAGWAEWSTCSTSCGAGLKVRQRACTREPCDGSAHERRSCNAGTCHNRGGGSWTQWSGFSGCSKSCGRGIKTRSRSCSGSGCHGSRTEQVWCNTQRCPGRSTVSRAWSTWSAWSSCSVSCGAGVKRRTRFCRSGSCPGNYSESAICNDRECGNRNANWGGWGYWSTCSETCGNGLRKRVRKCYGSGRCNGNEYEKQNCYMRSCPSRRF